MKKLLVILFVLMVSVANAQVAGTCINGRMPNGDFDFIQMTSDRLLKSQIYGEFAISCQISTYTLIATNTVTFLASITGNLTPPFAIEMQAWNKIHHGVATSTVATVQNYVYLSQNDIKVIKCKTTTCFNMALLANATTGPATMTFNIYLLE